MAFVARALGRATRCPRLGGLARPALFSLSATPPTPPEFSDHVRLEEGLLARAAERDKSIRVEHLRLNTSFSEASHGDTRIDAEGVRRKRLIYRSKQRGWLEVWRVVAFGLQGRAC